MQDQSKVMFVHVPRTAGTSIIKQLFLPVPKRYPSSFYEATRIPFYQGHDPIFSLNKLNNTSEFFKFTVVRNPYTRAYSNYKAFLNQLKHINQKFNNVTFKEFLQYVRTRGNTLFSHVIYTRAPFCVFDQCFYIHDDDGEIGVDKIYRFENLTEFEKDFNINLQNVNSSETSMKEYLDAYDKSCIQLVNNLYHIDFCILKYSMNFEDSIK